MIVMSGLFGIDLNFIITVVIIIIFISMILKFLKGITVNIKKNVEKEKIDPTTTGERLKKYFIQAVRLNPKTAKFLYLERTNWGEGGKIGRIYGHISDKDCTAFIIKRSIIGKKQLLYCPVDMHTTLHQKNVVIHGVSLHSAGGYLWPIPLNEEKTSTIFKIVSRAFEKDLRRMMIFDAPQIEVEQIYEGITGFNRDEAFYDEPETIEEQYTAPGDNEEYE